jgi:hypothetical protein
MEEIERMNCNITKLDICIDYFVLFGIVYNLLLILSNYFMRFIMHYNAGDNIFYHFYQHTVFGLAHDIPRFGHGKNWVETLGDVGLWPIENFPGKVWSLMKEPRWVTFVLAQIALAGTSYLFYPKESLFYANVAISKLPLPSRETAKFAVYLTIVAHIVSAALRAYGRFRNDELMDDWYASGHAPHAAVPLTAPVAPPHVRVVTPVVQNDEEDDV